jgi:hypothetical protein
VSLPAYLVKSTDYKAPKINKNKHSNVRTYNQKDKAIPLQALTCPEVSRR